MWVCVFVAEILQKAQKQKSGEGEKKSSFWGTQDVYDLNVSPPECGDFVENSVVIITFERTPFVHRRSALKQLMSQYDSFLFPRRRRFHRCPDPISSAGREKAIGWLECDPGGGGTAPSSAVTTSSSWLLLSCPSWGCIM